MPGSEKIRRIIEVLRTDVIRGLGIQLLERVYDILEEEDELLVVVVRKNVSRAAERLSTVACFTL